MDPTLQLGNAEVILFRDELTKLKKTYPTHAISLEHQEWWLPDTAAFVTRWTVSVVPGKYERCDLFRGKTLAEAVIGAILAGTPEE